jgi:hypothetical protein
MAPTQSFPLGHLCGWSVVASEWRCLQDRGAKGFRPDTGCGAVWGGDDGSACLPRIEYVAGCEPVPRSDWEREHGRPSVQARIWREGDIGWLADIIETAWSRWLLVYPGEWRTVGQAIPYVHLRSTYNCDRPRNWIEWEMDDVERDYLVDADTDAWSAWKQGGLVGPEPGWPRPWTHGHMHRHDHGICLDPWLVDGATDGDSLEATLQHELAHAIAGDYGHDDAWLAMCEVIGYRPDEWEMEQEKRDTVADADSRLAIHSGRCPACGATAADAVGQAQTSISWPEAVAIFADDIEALSTSGGHGW